MLTVKVNKQEVMKLDDLYEAEDQCRYYASKWHAFGEVVGSEGRTLYFCDYRIKEVVQPNPTSLSNGICEMCGHEVAIDGMLECEKCLNRMALYYTDEEGLTDKY